MPIINRIGKSVVSLENSLLEAMKLMDEVKVKTLFVLNDNHFEGILTIGDIQRAIIRGIPLTETIKLILSKAKVYGYANETEEIIRDNIARRVPL